MLWKYRTLNNDLEKKNNDFKINKTEIEKELKLLENESNNLDNLKLLGWD